MLTPGQIASLSAPFPPASISWRVGSTTKDKSRGMALAYIDARDVMRRLDESVGPHNWKDEYHDCGKRLICTIHIRCGDEWVGKSDGAGDSDVEPEKGGISDAFKRAAVKWGIGRYLYDLDSPWVELEARGNSYSIKQSEYAKLRELLDRSVKPAAPAKEPSKKESSKKDEPKTEAEWHEPIDMQPAQFEEITKLLATVKKEPDKAAKWVTGNRTDDINKLTFDEARRLIMQLQKTTA